MHSGSLAGRQGRWMPMLQMLSDLLLVTLMHLDATLSWDVLGSCHRSRGFFAFLTNQRMR